MNAALLHDDDQPLRVKTIAAWLGVSDKTVRRLINRLELKSIKMGGLRLVRRGDFMAYWEKLNQAQGSHV